MAYVACVEGGFTDVKLAKLFGVSKSTINLWKRVHPEFSDSTRRGKDQYNRLDAEKSLLKLIKGFRYTETTKEAKPIVTKNTETGEEEIIGEKLLVTKKVHKFIPPNERSIRFFLKNRDPARWRDTQAVEVTGNDGGPIKQELTNFPSGPLSLAEWERQVLEVDEQNAKLLKNNSNSEYQPHGVLSTLNRTDKGKTMDEDE